MKNIGYIFLKELKVRFRYRISWINMSLTPFFILAPYVYTAKGVNTDLEGMVLVGSIIWFWLNQYFFGVGNAFSEERSEGTMVSIVLSPASIMEFLIGKGLWIMVNCIYITIITMFIFRILDITQGFSLEMFILYILNGIYTFAFAIFFSSFVLIYRNLSSINAVIQQAIGIFSGMTANVNSYPRVIRFISYIIPLTYQIRIGRDILSGATLANILPTIIVLTVVTVVFFVAGLLLLHKAEIVLRRKGGWEVW